MRNLMKILLAPQKEQCYNKKNKSKGASKWKLCQLSTYSFLLFLF